ncbi:MAG: hypothetical protein OEN56_11525 [Gemmatimonadota bacterium]|nr:hypothetical protein [Gemmatimonadota bacterium]
MTLRITDFFVVLVAVILLASDVQAQESDNRAEGARFLLLPVGAQGVSLGRAMTWVEGPEGAFWNPAGLAGVERSQGVVLRGDHPVGDATAVSALLARPGLGTLGASYFLLDVGDIDQTDEFGNYTGTITIRNHLGIVSGATRLASRLDVGVSLKVIRFQFSCRGICPNEGTTATTYAVDAGVQGRPSDRLRVGAMVAHVGPNLQVLNAEQSDPLPARVRVAAAYDVVAAFTGREDLQGWLALEVQDRLRDLGSLSYYLGTEFTAGLVDALSLRAGYVWSDLPSEDGGRVGLGLRYERFELAIAKSLAVSTLADETDAVHVSFSIGF